MTYPSSKVQNSEFNSDTRNAVQVVNTSIIFYENEEFSFRSKLTISAYLSLVILQSITVFLLVRTIK